MQQRVTVALAMVWLAYLVGVFSTSTPLPPFVDQYSPQLAENHHGVSRGPQNLANRMLWGTLQNRLDMPIYVKPNDLSNEKLRQEFPAFESLKNETTYQSNTSSKRDVFIGKLTALNMKTQVKNAMPTNKESPSVITVEKRDSDNERKLQTDFDDTEMLKRKKRTIKLSSNENRYFVQDTDPFVAIEFGTVDDDDENDDGQYYEEMDELLRVRQEEKIRQQPKSPQTRGDIPVNDEDSGDTSSTSDIPLRGDIGVANALAMAGSSQLMNTTEKAENIRTNGTSMSVIDVTASNGGRRLARLQKRETIDFSRSKVESSWGYGENEGADLLRKKKPKGVKHKKRTNMKVFKRNQNNRWRTNDRPLGHLMPHETAYRRRSREDDSDMMLEKKLQDYISRNTPIDIRRNRRPNNTNNYNRERNDNRRNYMNNNRRGQVPNNYQLRDPMNRRIYRTRHQNHDQRQNHGHTYNDRRMYPDTNDQRTASDPRQDFDRRTSHNQRPYNNQRLSPDRTEGTIERTSLNPNENQEGRQYNPYDRNQNNDRTHSIQNFNQPDVRHQSPIPSNSYDPQQPYNSRNYNQNQDQINESRPNYHHLGYQYPKPSQSNYPQQNYDAGYHYPKPEQFKDRQTSTNYDPRYNQQNIGQFNDPRENYDARSNIPNTESNEPKLHHSGRYYNTNANSIDDSNAYSPMSKLNNDKVDDYIRRNTAIDIRSPSNYGNANPYQGRIDTSYSVPGNVPNSINSFNQQKTVFPSALPVDSDSNRKYETNVNHRNQQATYDQQHNYSQHRYRPNHLQNGSTRWKSTISSGYEQERDINVQPEGDWGKTKEQETRYQEFRGNPTSINAADFEKSQHAPVQARIYITPNLQSKRYKRDVEYAPIDPHHKGLVADGFPVPATKKPPVEGPSLCIWAVTKCCPNSTRRKNCFEAHGCPEISWDPDPCRKSVRDAAIDEIRKFYANTEDVYA